MSLARSVVADPLATASERRQGQPTRRVGWRALLWAAWGAALVAVLVAAVFAIAGRAVTADALASQVRHVQHAGSALAANIEAALAVGDTRHVRQLVGQTTSLPDLLAAAYVDAAGAVVALTVPGEEKGAVASVATDLPATLRARAAARQAGIVASDDADDRLWALFPVGGIEGGGRLRASGHVVLVLDQRALRQHARDRAAELAVTVAVPVVVLVLLAAAAIRASTMRHVEPLLRRLRAPAADGRAPSRARRRGPPARIAELESAVGAVADARDAAAAVFEALPLPVWEADVRGRFVRGNAAWRRFTGSAAEMARGENRLRGVHPDDVARREATLRLALTGGETVVGEHRMLGEDGCFQLVRERCAPLLGIDGMVRGAICTFEDLQPVIEAAQAQRMRSDARIDALTERNRELEDFAGTLSHDLKAPLRAIDAYSYLLMTEHASGLDDAGRDHLVRVRQGVERMRRLIDDLLTYARLERSGTRMQTIALGEIVGDILAEREDEIARGGVRIDLDVGDVAVVADRMSLTQALHNLIDNALKYSRDARQPRISIAAVRDGNVVRIAVRDNGIGFDMRHHDGIFGMFRRLHGEDEFPGTGLGLAIVHKAMKRMGGRVWAESAPKQGACFYLELPR